jgi:hypothetical protein
MTGCCSGRIQRLRVGDMDVGMTGLSEIFERFAREGRLPDLPETRHQLVKAAQQAGNYITATWEDRYASALREAYARFCRKIRP